MYPFVHAIVRRARCRNTICELLAFEINDGEASAGIGGRWSIPSWELVSEVLQPSLQHAAPALIGICRQADVVISLDASLVMEAQASPAAYLGRIPFREVILQRWLAWEAIPVGDTVPIMAVLGCATSLLPAALIFEVIASGLDQGHRHLLAEKLGLDILKLQRPSARSTKEI